MDPPSSNLLAFGYGDANSAVPRSLMGLLGEEPAPLELTDKSSPTLATYDEEGGEPQQPAKRRRATSGESAFHGSGQAYLSEDSSWQGHAGGAQHQQQGACDPSELCDGAADAELVGAEAGGSHQEPESEDDAGQGQPLTTTTMNGIAMMEESMNNIEYKMREMVRVGVTHLDEIKAAFVGEMDRLIAEMHALRDSQRSRWGALAAATQQEERRLETAKALMNRLGLDATSCRGGESQE